MNPEFERNLWLELTPRRVLQMVIVLGLIFLTLKVADPFDGRDRAAEFLFFAIVVIWGTREAAQSVVEEIRDRTWDFQRLSALTPFNMTWGELFGATSYIWLGGLICLAVMIAVQGSPVRPLNIFADLAIGLTAQSAALFASLLAVRRRQSITRLSVFQYQMFGIATAAAMWALWEPVANATMPICVVRVWREMNSRAALRAASSRVGSRSVAFMLPDTSMARITVSRCDGSVRTAFGRAIAPINAITANSDSTAGTCSITPPRFLTACPAGAQAAYFSAALRLRETITR